MDWGFYDEEGAMRQRYLEIDDRTEDAKDFAERVPLGVAAFQEMYDISWLYHENGLEGVVLTFPEIKSAVDNKVISDVSLLPTYNEIKNQKACIDLIRDKAKSRRFSVTIPFLRDLHQKLLRDNGDPNAYRKDIPIHRTYFHEIAHPTMIEQRLTEVLEYLKARHDRDLHPIEFAANVHHRFMRVFPFSGTSGMVGRLVLNFVLMRQGYLPCVIHASDRQSYYEALRGPERDFRLFVVEAMENSLENAIRFLSQVQAQAQVQGSARRAAQ